MLSVFLVLVFFRVLPPLFFGFLSFYPSEVPFLDNLLYNQMVRIHSFYNGDLGSKNLLALQGEMLSFFFRLLFRAVRRFFSYSEIGCVEMSFGITKHQLTSVTSSVVGRCFSPSCIIPSYIDLTTGLLNVFSDRSLGLRGCSRTRCPI